MSDLPRWIKAAALLGAPTVFAGYFGWWITGSEAAKTNEILQLMRSHATATMQVERALQVIVDINRVTCSNGARSDQQRERCERAGSAAYYR